MRVNTKQARMAGIWGLAVAAACAWTLPTVHRAASAQSFTYAKTGMTMNGQAIYISDHIVMKDPWSGHETSWLPIYYLDSALTKLGVKISWNGTRGHWDITMSKPVTSLPAKTSSSANGASEATIQINGRDVEVVPRTSAPDPITGKPTTYLPVYYIEQVLQKVGVTSHWDGKTWAMTSSSLHYVQGTLNLLQIHMMSPNVGWALSNEHVWRTTDGGQTWSNVTPTGYSFGTLGSFVGITGEGAVDFSGNSDAWFAETSGAQNASTNRTILQYTSDGGAIWNKTVIPTSGMGGYLDFVNAKDGWMLSDLGVAAGSEGVAVWQTTNGGQSWTKTAVGDLNHAALPFNGDKTGIRFVSPKVGWVTGSNNGGLNALLYQTTNGGTTWQHQSLTVPSSLKNSTVNLMPPMFFAGGNGVLADVVGGGTSASHLVLYGRRSESSSWTMLSNSALAPGNIDTVQFLNPTTGFALVHRMTKNYKFDGYSLYRTTDAGQQWTDVGNVNQSTDLTSLDFVSDSTGFVIERGQGNDSTLLATNDGGSQWSALTPHEQTGKASGN